MTQQLDCLKRRRRQASACARALLATLVALSPYGLARAETGGLIGVRAAHVASAKPQVSLARATAAHLDNGADSATLTFDLSHPVETTAFVMTDPDRVIVDLPQVDFDLDAEVGHAAEPRRGRHAKTKPVAGLVASYRFGLLSPGRSRVVVDLTSPATIARTSVEKVGDKFRLVIALAKTDDASFRRVAQSRLVEPPAPARPALRSAESPDRPTIVLDPGHGGPDIGATVNGVVEKTIALDFAQALAKKLEAGGGFNVVMTRPNDVFIPLSERVRIARAANAALMISIHADTLTESGDVSGATVYTVSDKASDAAAAKVAAKENEADSAVGLDGQADAVDVSDILFDLTRRETRAYSHVFARTLVDYWKVAGRLNKNPRRAAGFRVLKAPDVPSVLLELGYLSNKDDVIALTSPDWRDKATGKMAEAIVAYFADRHGIEKAQAGVMMPDPAHALIQASAATAVRK